MLLYCSFYQNARKFVMKNIKPPEVFSLTVLRRKSDVMDLDLTKADFGIQQDDSLGIWIGIALVVYGSEGTAGICFYGKALRNKNHNFAEGTSGFDGAVFCNFLAAGEIHGQLAET